MNPIAYSQPQVFGDAECVSTHPHRLEEEFTVLNHLGMHARPAAEFVRCARRFKSTIEILVRGKRFSAQRLLEVLLAGLHAGIRFQLVAEGPDARLALDTLGALLKQQAEAEKIRAAEGDSFRWR